MTFYILGSSFLIALISIIGIVTAAFNERLLRRSLVVLVSLALGAFLGDAFIHLIPEAIEDGVRTDVVALITIFGILLSFLVEKILGWHHGHGHDAASPEECVEETHAHAQHGKDAPHLHGKEIHTHEILPLGKMVLFSDAIHNFVDGIIIGASFLVSVEVGIATTLAVALHEIPQEIGDFGILLYAGYEKIRALWLNFLSALSVVFGAAIFLVSGELIEGLVPYVLPFAAGTFIYLAASDLIPELHKRQGLVSLLLQLTFIVVGVAAMYGLLFLE